jgi:tRNA(Arg) A34 adenosine deaminase TadA
MHLTTEQINLLKKLMVESGNKGNLANSGLVIDKNGKTIASSESLVVTNNDATAHSERLLVEKVCKLRKNNYNPGLTMITVVEPCLMCMSACSQAGYDKIAYIIPAKRYVEKIAWMNDVKENIDKKEIAESFSDPIELIHLSNYEEEFCEVFEKSMEKILK